MKRSGIRPYLVFATTYIVSGLLLAAVYDGLSASMVAATVAGWITTFMSAFASVWLARRFGDLGYAGLIVAATAVFVVSMAATVGILHAIATRGGSEAGLAHVISQLEWRMVARLFVQTVGLPLLALFLAQRSRVLPG